MHPESLLFPIVSLFSTSSCFREAHILLKLILYHVTPVSSDTLCGDVLQIKPIFPTTVTTLQILKSSSFHSYREWSFYFAAPRGHPPEARAGTSRWKQRRELETSEGEQAISYFNICQDSIIASPKWKVSRKLAIEKWLKVTLAPIRCFFFSSRALVRCSIAYFWRSLKTRRKEKRD